MILRDYQQSIFDQVVGAETNDLVQLDTGAGKTPIIAKLAEHYGDAVIVCHRNILIKQASEKLALCGLTHKIHASKATKKICANNNIAKAGRHYINPRSSIELASIDTINSRVKSGEMPISKNAKILFVDEAHHLADDNKWAALADKLNIRCVGFTATPCRSDGYPMIKQFGGFFDDIIQAEGYQDDATERLISEGYLAQYSAFLAIFDKEEGATRSGISDHKEIWLGHSALYAFEQYAENKQTIVIESRIANAIDNAAYFNRFGVKAEVIHSELPQVEIERILQAFEAKHIRVLVAVDMINEGFDVPDADVLILSRVVRSFGLYRQLCGRVLRPRPGKKALILDLNGASIAKHGLPSDPVNWRARQGRIKRKNITACVTCGFFFKATLTECPNCGAEHEIERRATGIGAGLEKHFFDAKMIEAERKRLAKEKARELKDAQEKKQRKLEATTYIKHSRSFGKSIIDKRCEHFYNTLQHELQSQLTPQQYNDFFKAHNLNMNDMNFYIDSFTGDFDKNPAAQCKRLYQSKK